METTGDETRYSRGLELLTQVNGAPGEQEINPIGDLGRYITEFGFGDVYSRPGLSLRDREFAAVGMLLGLGERQQQLRYHFGAALRAGVTAQQLEELVIQSALYAGFPVAINAIGILKEVVAEANAAGLKKN